MFDDLRARGFDIMVRNHAEAILSVDFAAEMHELLAAIAEVRIPVQELIASGGGEAQSTQRMRRRLYEAGWRKHNFRIETTIDGRPRGDGTSHEIDHVRDCAAGVLALEIEWNNKDPFFDRDLENFQRLHAQSVISTGIVVTRGASLQRDMVRLIEDYLRGVGASSEDALFDLGMKERTSRQRDAVTRAIGLGQDFAGAFARQFVADKFGMASTHWSKLADRISRGVGNPCPLLLIGLPVGVVTPYSAAASPEL